MYINFKNFSKSGLSVDSVFLLCAVKQNNFKYMSNFEKELEELLLTGYLEKIKGRKSQPELEKIRLGSKGKDILEKLEEIEVSEETEIIFSWLSDYYKKHGKEVGNGSKTKRWIETFTQKTGIRKNNLVILCKAFIYDESNMEYNNKLEYAFFKPKTLFETKFQLGESRLYNYYLKHKEQFDKVFKEEE